MQLLPLRIVAAVWEQGEDLASIFQEYWDLREVFSKKGLDELPPYRLMDYAIEILLGVKLPKLKLYSMTPRELDELRMFIDASNMAVGAVLLQKDYQGRLQSFAYTSKKFSETESRWMVWGKEAYTLRSAPWKEISMNFIVELPKISGNTIIRVTSSQSKYILWHAQRSPLHRPWQNCLFNIFTTYMGHQRGSSLTEVCNSPPNSGNNS